MDDTRRNIPVPTFTPIPCEVDMSEEIEEPSGVHNIKQLWSKVDIRTRELLKYAEDTSKKAQCASDSALAASIRINEQGIRITSIETSIRAGHNCVNVNRLERIECDVDKIEEKLEKDVQKGIKQLGAIEATETAIMTVNDRINKTNKRLDDDSNKYRNSWILAISMFVGFIATIVGAVYGYGELNTNVANDRRTNVEQHKVMTTAIEKSNAQVSKVQSDTAKNVENQLRNLRLELAASNGHEQRYETLCIGMSSHNKHQQRILFDSNNRRIPESCR